MKFKTDIEIESLRINCAGVYAEIDVSVRASVLSESSNHDYPGNLEVEIEILSDLEDLLEQFVEWGGSPNTDGLLDSLEEAAQDHVADKWEDYVPE